WAVANPTRSPSCAVVFSSGPPVQRTASRLDQRLLRHVDRVLASGTAEADFYSEAGVSRERLAVIPPGLAAPARAEEVHTRDARIRIACVGPLEPHKGFHDALWAFDIL